MNRRFRRLPIFILVLCAIHACQDGPGARKETPRAASVAGPVKPADALSTFEVEDGFKVELIASEPLISDPVDMEIDEMGRLYVVEMHGYPLDKTGTGVIKLLSDSNADGRFDKSTLFADGLTLPNSIMRWKKGLLVTDAPNLFYFEDTNGDGKADIKDTMLTGFALSNPQHNLNSPVLGIDNWIYLGHEGAVSTQTYQEEFGDPGTVVYYPHDPAAPKLPPNASGRSVRFRPDQHLLETTSSNTQFGHSFDTWGHHLLVSNSNHIFHEVVAAAYLKRNPQLLVSDATQSNSDHGDAAEVFPITRNPERQLLTDVGVITSACGITYYQGGMFPAPYDRVSFVAEPVSNLVHVDRIRDSGASFVASRIHPNKEFLASTDAWFRPVNMYVGPDGALYVVDYYRQIIEHPEWMGEEVVKSGKLYNGHDMGRIYRVSPTGAKPAAWIKGLQLGKATSEALVSELSNPNSWWRLNAQRLLVDRNDQTVVPKLAELAKSGSPLGRLHALWTMEGLNALQPASLESAFRDPVPGIRENAIKLAEAHLATAPQLATDLVALQNDPDPKVRYQLLCTLGFVNSSEASQARNNLLFRDMDDEWAQVAALSAAASQSGSLLQAVIDSFRSERPAYASLLQRLSAMIGRGTDATAISRLVDQGTTPGNASSAGWRAPLLNGLAAGLKAKGAGVTIGVDAEKKLVNILFTDSSGKMRDAAFELLSVTGIRNAALKRAATEKAAALAGDSHAAEEKRVQAIRFLSLGDPSAHRASLQQLISPGEPSSVQVAALHTLSKVPDTAFSHFLLERWANLTPEVLDEAMNNFLVNDQRIAMLLNAIERGTVQPATVGWGRSVHLMAQRNLPLREKARRLLTRTDAEGEKVNQHYRQALTLQGDLANGKTVYLQNCSSCHQVRGTMGFNFGPDLGTIHNWSAEAIMANILAPNLSISSGYDLWSVELKNGQSLQGIISSETATAITLKNASRDVKTINRSDIRSLKAMNMSSMPAGLEKQINEQQMADLLAFLRQNK